MDDGIDVGDFVVCWVRQSIHRLRVWIFWSTLRMYGVMSSMFWCSRQPPKYNG